MLRVRCRLFLFPVWLYWQVVVLVVIVVAPRKDTAWSSFILFTTATSDDNGLESESGT